MKHILLATTFVLMFITSLSAQHEVFSVMISKGENSYGDPGKLKPVLIGSGMHNDQLLHIADNGYVSLVHEQTGASIELKVAGDYSVSELEQLIGKRSVSILTKYARFLVGKLSPSQAISYQLNSSDVLEPAIPSVMQLSLPEAD